MQNEKDLKLAAMHRELTKMRQQFHILQKITTTQGFYQLWFESLPKYKSFSEAFNAVNELHYKLTVPHKFKYTSYKSFQNQIKKLKQTK